MTFGEKLFKLRKEKGLSQEQLAEQMNTTRQAVSKWENDQGFPETEKLMMLGNIFSVSIDYLLKNSKVQGVEIDTLNTVIGAHSGPGTVALFFFGKQRYQKG